MSCCFGEKPLDLALGRWPCPRLLLGRALAGGFLQDPAGSRAEERPATGSVGHQRCGAWDSGWDGARSCNKNHWVQQLTWDLCIFLCFLFRWATSGHISGVDSVHPDVYLRIRFRGPGKEPDVPTWPFWVDKFILVHVNEEGLGAFKSYPFW